MKRICLSIVVFAFFHAGLWCGRAQFSAFTFQGRLADQGAPASGNYDLTFTLFDAPSAPNVSVASATGSNAVIISTISNGAVIALREHVRP